MNIKTLKQLPTVKKIEIPVYAALYEMRRTITENAPKFGRQKCENLYEVWQKLENEIDDLYADNK